MLSAREVDAQEALRLGIVLEVQHVGRAAATCAGHGGQLRSCEPGRGEHDQARRRRGDAGDLRALLEVEANAQAVAFGTPQHREAVQRFLDKQPAHFQWPK